MLKKTEVNCKHCRSFLGCNCDEKSPCKKCGKERIDHEQDMCQCNNSQHVHSPKQEECQEESCNCESFAKVECDGYVPSKVITDEQVFNPPSEQSLDAFLTEQINQKAFAVAFKEWFGRYGNITFENNLSGEIEPIWNNAGTRERWSVKSMADIFLLGVRYGRGFKIGKLNCANCETHLGTNYIGSILIRKGKEHYFCDSANHNLDEFYCLRKWLETKQRRG